MVAVLRMCASCEWIYKKVIYCPKCGFVSYSARYVYGEKAYRYAKTQEPWIQKKLTEAEIKLREEIARCSPPSP